MEIESEDAPAKAYYIDGCVVKGQYVYIASKLFDVDPEEYDLTRMCVYREGKWSMHDLAWDVCSVCCWESERRHLCALSVHGEVSLVSNAGYATERIPDAGAAKGFGAMSQIRTIGGSLYACGFHGQVYRRLATRWVHVDDGLLERDISISKLYLTGIDGMSESDIYVVGLHGRIHHWNGASWREIKSPTKAHLERVRCVKPDEVYICGNNGSLLQGNARDGFRLWTGEVKENFWGLEVFGSKVYLAALSGLFFFDGETVQPLKTALEPEIKGYRLDAGDGVLWSFGADDLAYFDGKRWTRVIDPDNE